MQWTPSHTIREDLVERAGGQLWDRAVLNERKRLWAWLRDLRTDAGLPYDQAFMEEIVQFTLRDLLIQNAVATWPAPVVTGAGGEATPGASTAEHCRS